MEIIVIKFIGAGLATLGMLGAALGVGSIFAALLNSVARNPAAAEQLQRLGIIGAGLAEAMGLFSFVVAILIIFS